MYVSMGFFGGLAVKNLLTKQETWVPSLDLEDPLKKEMVTHFSILAWRIPWTEEPGGLLSIGLQRVRHTLTAEHTGTRAVNDHWLDGCMHA